MMKTKNYLLILFLLSLVSCQESLDQLTNDPFVSGDNQDVVNAQLIIPTATRVELKNGLFYLEGENFDRLTDITVRRQDGQFFQTAIYRKTNDSLIAGIIDDINPTRVRQLFLNLILGFT